MSNGDMKLCPTCSGAGEVPVDQFVIGASPVNYTHGPFPCLSDACQIVGKPGEFIFKLTDESIDAMYLWNGNALSCHGTIGAWVPVDKTYSDTGCP